MTNTVRFNKIGGPEVLNLEQIEVDEPGPEEVLVRVEAIGLNRAEALYRSGHYLESPDKFPAGLGYEASGIIEQVGPGAIGFSAGQAVSVIPAFSQTDYSMYAERAIAPVRALVPRSEDIDAVTGAAVWMAYLTAYGAMVDVGRMRPGDTVVLNAASSSVGLAAIQVANHLGATPIAVTRSPRKRSALLEEGAAAVVVSGEGEVDERILDLTSGRGADLVLDAVSGPDLVTLSKSLARGGTHIVYGALSGRPTPFPTFDLVPPPLNLRTFTMHEISRDPERLRHAVAFIESGLRGGALRPLIDRVFDLDAIVEAHRRMESGEQFGKIVVTT